MDGSPEKGFGGLNDMGYS